MRIYIYFVFIISSLFMGCKSVQKTTPMQEVLGLQKLGDLATAEYVVTKLIKANDNNTWYKLGDRKILMSCKARIVAGIDMSAISEKNIAIDGDNISLTIPHAKVLYLDIRPEDIKKEYEEVSLFRSNFSADERNELAAQAERQINNSVDSLGVLLTAETNATIFINSLLKKEGFTDIRINFSSTKLFSD